MGSIFNLWLEVSSFRHGHNHPSHFILLTSNQMSPEYQDKLWGEVWPANWDKINPQRVRSLTRPAWSMGMREGEVALRVALDNWPGHAECRVICCPVELTTNQSKLVLTKSYTSQRTTKVTGWLPSPTQMNVWSSLSSRGEPHQRGGEAAVPWHWH